MAVSKVPVPAGLLLDTLMPRRQFQDSYSGRLAASAMEMTPVELARHIFGRMPRWIEALMAARNRIAGWIGLKNVGALAGNRSDAPTAAIGGRIGAFTVYGQCADEVVFGERDSHLDVMISVHRRQEAGQERVYVTTSVDIHNWVGRLYMLVVAPAHRIIAPAGLRASGLTQVGG